LLRKLKGLIPNKKELVNFIICGAQKAGTTALYAYLKDHPEICMADRKEAHFFNDETNFGNGKPNYAKYHSLFAPEASNRIAGEATPIYMYWYDAPRRIWEYNPDMKLIVVLRNPIYRAYSHWNMEKSRKAENLPFWDAIQCEEQRCKDALPYQHNVCSYVDRGFYLEQLRRLWHYFPKKNILILKNEYLRRQPDKALKDVCEFLAVAYFERIENKNIHSLPYSSKMDDREKECLQDIFKHEIEGLERALGWDCSDWMSEWRDVSLLN
jgi:hypothetical protein